MELTGGLEVRLDAKDYPLVAKYRWYASKYGKTWYAKADYRLPDGKMLRLAMHRVIAGGGKQVDHWDKNGLNNQRFNLRAATHSQNQANRAKGSNSVGKYKGVYNTKRPLAKPWMAHIRVNYKMKNLGYYATEEEAALAYNVAAKQFFGDFAELNDLSKGKVDLLT